MSRLILLLSIFLLPGCSTIHSPRATQNSQDNAKADEEFLSELSQENQDGLTNVKASKRKSHRAAFGSKEHEPTPSIALDIEREILDEDLDSTSAPVVSKRGKHSVPLEINQAVEGWIKIFTEQERERFARYLKRSGRYERDVKKILAEEGVPQDLFYLVMIESGFSNNARSRVGATGPWQFMYGTAKNYGLKTNYYIDERRDPWKSTRAAARYLRGLYKAFGSWYLAIASYNAGEVRTLRAILKSDTRDFWELAEQKLLPKETMNYIPKFIAATLIAKHPERYGFDPAEVDPPLNTVQVEVPGFRRITDIAKSVSISSEDLELINPEILRGVTPPEAGGYALRIPAGLEEQIIAKVDSLPKIALRKMNDSYSGSGYHHVRAGESLHLIARKYKVSLKSLVRSNSLRSPYKIFPGQKLRLPGGEHDVSGAGSKSTYVVKRGDSLFAIAKRFNISIGSIKEWNKLSGNSIYPGQKLQILAGS